MAEPKEFVLHPDGKIVSSGWPAVRDTCAKLGIFFDPWQEEWNRALLAKRPDGLYAMDTGVASICRQAGKTYSVGSVIFADSIINPGTRTAWTAHKFSTARESFDELQSLATLPSMRPHVDPDAIRTGSGNEVIPFRNGSKIMFKSRERGSLRGFTNIRRAVFDEAQILTESPVSDIAPTMLHAKNPQVIYMGTPPKPEDPSEIFTSFRDSALDGSAEPGLLYLEYGADPSCDPSSWEAVEQANPSYPLRVGKRSIKFLRKQLKSDEAWAREGLGVWDAHGSGVVIDPDVWAALADANPPKRTGRPVFAVDVTPGQTHTSIAVAFDRGDGKSHVELAAHRPGTRWAVDKLVELTGSRKGSKVTLDPSGTAGSLLTDLQDAGIDPELVSGREMAQACGNFYDLVVNEGTVTHFGQPQLSSAVNAGRKRNLSEAWAWHRRDTDADISPLVAVTLALHALGKPKEREKVGTATFF